MDDYLWIKALHIIAIVILIAGMVLNGFLFRNLKPGTPDSDRLVTSARRWNLFIILPALLVVWILGLSLAFQGNWYMDGWLMVKFVAVFLLSGLHGAQMGALRRMQTTPNTAVSPGLYHSATITIIFVVLIVLLVVIKPAFS